MMTPDEAALCLRDDPTFATASRADQEEEAALLLGSDDPLDIALAIEAALAAPVKAAAAIVLPGTEPCRLNGPDGAPCGGNEPIAGNGRCLTCGARRVAEAVPAAAAPIEPKRPAPRPAAVLPGLRQGVRHDPAASFIGRFKEATGATDKEAAALLGVARTTAQAYANGHRTELLDGAQVKILMDDLADRLVLLADLKRDLAASIGQVDYT